eukprot:CAMPEP_0171327750 /NCGR_PEP_ID=MMETSP0878-20121228/222_1 /TAXON_ID=67004 /ORGANISM="Thalassiosira weissflogii, Strain CCMP1336" /LENGTH=238 /DNA_ID=CAMNT_0011827549 /DNA_START=140 /DNA_END=856 /DNA_ORIENTATION=+
MKPTLPSTMLPTRSYHATITALSPDWHGTTIVCVRKNGRICMMGDGMVSMGSVIVKPNARKIRRIYPKTVGGKIHKGGSESAEGDDGENNEGTIVGFAGTTADAFTLLERLESKLDEYPGQLTRSCVELAKGWRTDKYLRRLEASLLVADKKTMLEITGNGDVLESYDGVLGVGSGSNFAVAAARAQMDQDDKSAEEVARRAMEIAADMCIYTNNQFMMESVKMEEESEEKEEDEGKK